MGWRCCCFWFRSACFAAAATIRSGAGGATPGDISAFTVYMSQILISLTMMTNIFTIFVRTKASALRIKEVFDAEEDFAPVEGAPEPIDDDLMGALAGEPGRFIVVGLIDATIVGFGAMHLETLHDHDVLAVVTDLYVVKEARGVGVGEAMMDLLLDHAGDAGAVGIDALALPGDRATKNFFERFGLTARAILVHRSLRSPEAASGGEYR